MKEQYVTEDGVAFDRHHEAVHHEKTLLQVILDICQRPVLVLEDEPEARAERTVAATGEKLREIIGLLDGTEDD